MQGRDCLYVVLATLHLRVDAPQDALRSMVAQRRTILKTGLVRHVSAMQYKDEHHFVFDCLLYEMIRGNVQSCLVTVFF